MLTLLFFAATYLLPPNQIVQAFEAKPLPDAILSPARNVLALTERRAGFAESGAYNRTLTPFGFQSERRTF